VELVACWGRDAAKAARITSAYGGRAYDDLDAFVAHAGMQVVLIGTPSGLHVEHATRTVRRGLHVLVEKPLDVDVERIDRLLADAEREGVTVGVIFQDRTAPDVVWLRELISSGGLGRPLIASAQVKWYRPPEYYAGSRWRGTWALDGGGALMNQGIHTVDLLLWLFGDVARVTGMARTMLHRIEVEDTAFASVEFASGAIGTIEVTTAAYPGFPRRLELTGSEGTIVVESDRIASLDLRTKPETMPPRTPGNVSASASSPVVSDVSGHRRVIADFVDAVRRGRRPLCDGRDGRRSVALVQAIYRAAREGRPTDLP
jgi:UDP-N-acetyl-2-amino-2-deoxyglucuronate dehydrogenase